MGFLSVASRIRLFDYLRYGAKPHRKFLKNGKINNQRNANNRVEASCLSQFLRDSVPLTWTSKRVTNPDRTTAVKIITVPRHIITYLLALYRETCMVYQASYRDGKNCAIPACPPGQIPAKAPGTVAGWAFAGNAYLPIRAGRYVSCL